MSIVQGEWKQAGCLSRRWHASGCGPFLNGITNNITILARQILHMVHDDILSVRADEVPNIEYRLLRIE